MESITSPPLDAEKNQRIQRLFLTTPIIVTIIFFLFRIICLNSHQLLVEEAYYWNYAQHLDFGYLDHPPMVAILIKLSTLIIGENEAAIRIPALLCWVITAWFSFNLTQLMQRGAGSYALLLLSILPYFCLQSLVMTPDQPLLVCWSASLYYLFRSLVLNESKSWVLVGFWLGLGMLSKYTIVLLGPATLLYLATTPSARPWFFRKEPYFCVLIAILLFTPVIYWNATHDWASFVFQSSRRFHAPSVFSFHQFLGILILFLLPIGIAGLVKLCYQKGHIHLVNANKTRFLQVFTLVPLVFFGLFSLNHRVRLDWVGPGLLALIPWLAILIKDSKIQKQCWIVASVVLLSIYTSMMFYIRYATPALLPPKVLSKFIAWDDLSIQVNAIAHVIENKTHQRPIIMPLDQYNIGSELSFYQEKLKDQGELQKVFPIQGAHFFGIESLMFRFWSDYSQLSGRPLILISNSRQDFNAFDHDKRVIRSSKLFKIWSYAQKNRVKIAPYYYKIVELKL